MIRIPDGSHDANHMNNMIRIFGKCKSYASQTSGLMIGLRYSCIQQSMRKTELTSDPIMCCEVGNSDG